MRWQEDTEGDDTKMSDATVLRVTCWRLQLGLSPFADSVTEDEARKAVNDLKTKAAKGKSKEDARLERLFEALNGNEEIVRRHALSAAGRKEAVEILTQRTGRAAAEVAAQQESRDFDDEAVALFIKSVRAELQEFALYKLDASEAIKLLAAMGYVSSKDFEERSVEAYNACCNIGKENELFFRNMSKDLRNLDCATAREFMAKETLKAASEGRAVGNLTPVQFLNELDGSIGVSASGPDVARKNVVKSLLQIYGNPGMLQDFVRYEKRCAVNESAKNLTALAGASKVVKKGVAVPRVRDLAKALGGSGDDAPYLFYGCLLAAGLSTDATLGDFMEALGNQPSADVSSSSPSREGSSRGDSAASAPQEARPESRTAPVPPQPHTYRPAPKPSRASREATGAYETAPRQPEHPSAPEASSSQNRSDEGALPISSEMSTSKKVLFGILIALTGPLSIPIVILKKWGIFSTSGCVGKALIIVFLYPLMVEIVSTFYYVIAWVLGTVFGFI